MAEGNLDNLDVSPEDDTGLIKRLKEQLETNNRADKTRFNWTEAREEGLESWRSVIDGNDMAEMMMDLVSKSVLLPRADFQLPLAAAYLMLPTALCTQVPVGVGSGPSGTGKSVLAMIGCYISQTKAIAARSTARSIRTYVNSIRKYSPTLPLDAMGNEKVGGMLFWNDISPTVLASEDGFHFDVLKAGVNRSEGTFTKLNAEGGIDTYEVFCPKLTSSISKFYAIPEYRELIRRIVVFEHKKLEAWKAEDYCDCTRGLDTEDLLVLDELSWEGAKEEWEDYWLEASNRDRWVANKRALSAIRGHKIPRAIFKMFLDLYTCALTCRYFAAPKDAITHLKAYWEWHQENIEKSGSSTVRIIKEFIEINAGEIMRANQRAIAAGAESFCVPVELAPFELKKHIDAARANGLLDSPANDKERASIMESLGWRIGPGRSGASVWKMADD